MGSQIGGNKVPVDFDIKSEGDNNSCSDDEDNQENLQTKEPPSYEISNTPQKMKQQTFDFTSAKKAPDTSAAKKGVTEILENDDSFEANSPNDDDLMRPLSTFNVEEDQFDVQVEEMALPAN